MRKLFLIVILVILAIPLASLRSQVMDLSAIEGLTGNTSAYSNIDDQDDELKQDNQSEKAIVSNMPSLEASGYGFQGNSSFNSSPQVKINDVSMKYFGYDFFNDAPSTFSQLKNIPIPLNYVLGPGDVIKIILFGTDNRQLSLRISRNGEIVFPGIGPISLAGMNFRDMKETIEQMISTQFIGTKASITLGSLRSMNIFVLGEAIQPGMYTISSLSTLTNALFASGGVKTTGSLRNIELKRDGKTIQSFDFYDLLLNGDTSSDIQLMPNDVVFIPPINKTVGIVGEVIRNSNIYELKEGENISHLIQYAGGTTPKANLSNVEIQRIDFINKGYKLLSLDLNQLDIDEEKLSSGDVIYIYPVFDSMNKAILLAGHTQAPGFYPWKQGMILRDIIKSKKDLLPNTDLNYVLIKNNNLNRNLKLRQVNLEAYLSNTNKQSDIILDEKDEVFLFPKLLSLSSISSELIEFDLLSEQQKNYFLKQTETIKTFDENGLLKQERISPVPDTADKIDITKVKNDRFYEYKVNQYCLLPNMLAQKIVESGWIASYIDSNKIKEEEKIKDLNDSESKSASRMKTEEEETLNLELITEAQIRETSKLISSEEQLTDICRRQLLQEVLNIVRSQSSTLNPKQSVNIFGNVFFPGEYPLTQDMNISNLVNASGGLKDETLISQIELITTQFNGREYQRGSEILKISDAAFNNLELKPGDIVNIKRTPKINKSSRIVGQVYFPGDYPISKNETLGQLIIRAGGVNDQGNLKAAFFQRESLKKIEFDRLKKAQEDLKRNLIIASQTSNVGEEKNTDEFYFESLAQIIESDIDPDSLGRVIIDLPAILSGEAKDIILEKGDVLTIPRLQPIVSVIGEVFSPNAHLFKKSMTVSEFIEKSGGLTDIGSKEDIYIIKADGSVVPSGSVLNSGFFRRTSSMLEPGDTIVVPISISTYSQMRAATEITQVIYQMAIAAAAVNSF